MVPGEAVIPIHPGALTSPNRLPTRAAERALPVCQGIPKSRQLNAQRTWKETDMKTSHLVVALILAGLLTGPMAACSSTPTSQSTGEYIDDSAISNKVRAEFIADADLNVFQIDVTTYKGVVQLSGFVDSVSIKERAGSVAAGIDGVKGVRNDLIIK
jgi:hypothetical protein